MLADPLLEPLTSLVDALKEAWRAGADPDAPGALLEHPELLCHRSLVVDLAYEDYCVREEAGTAPEPDAFCNAFPAYRSQIREVIRGHRLLADHPDLLGPTAPAPWPCPGDQFEQLTIERELGRGAFARVYLARDPEAGREVVLKLAPGPSREARTLGPITHPHIVPVLWARRSGGFDAVCMPFAGTTTLRDAVETAFAANRTTPALTPRASDRTYPAWVARIGERLASAVEHLHSKKIVHGDLKPSNVLLGSGAHPYLIDFNLSTGLADAAIRCGGTLPYMPPERLRMMLGGAVETAPATAADVYSFGVVLFESLTGRVPVEPIESPDPNAVAADLLHRLTSRRPVRRPDVPAALAALVERCLDPNPDRRPTIAHVRSRLERYLGRPRRTRRAAGVLVALVATVGLSAAFVGAPKNVPVATVPEPRAVTPPVTADEHFAQGLRHLKEGAISPALKDFDTADRLGPSGPSAAYLAYCQSLTGQHRLAVGLYERAIQKHQFAPAWVRNNFARSLMMIGPTAARFRSAQEESQAALVLAPGSRPARLNRAYARFRLGLMEGKFDQTDSLALADLDDAMAVPPCSAELYSNAALMTIAFGGGRPECCARAVGYLEAAVRLGRPPAAFVNDRCLNRYLGKRADFQQLLLQPVGQADPAPTDPHLIPPPLD